MVFHFLFIEDLLDTGERICHTVEPHGIIMTDVLSVLIISICSLITFRNIRDARNRKVYVVRSHLELKPTAMVLLKIGFSVITITIFIIVCIMQLHTTRYAENQLIRMIFPMWLFVNFGVCKIVSL
jgi:hypothetical protein